MAYKGRYKPKHPKKYIGNCMKKLNPYIKSVQYLIIFTFFIFIMSNII